MSRMLSNCTHLHGHEFQPCSPAPPQSCHWVSSTLQLRQRHQHCRHQASTIPLYWNSLLFFQDIFQERGRKGEKKNCEKDFCALAVLEIFKLRTVTTPLSQQINLKQNKMLCFLKYKGHHRIRCHQNIPLIQNQQQIRLLPSSLGGQ